MIPLVCNVDFISSVNEILKGMQLLEDFLNDTGSMTEMINNNLVSAKTNLLTVRSELKKTDNTVKISK